MYVFWCLFRCLLWYALSVIRFHNFSTFVNNDCNLKCIVCLPGFAQVRGDDVSSDFLDVTHHGEQDGE